MPYTKVFKQINENLQIAYRQAIDADEKLAQLKKQGHGKFSSIFHKSQGFKSTSTSFLPYVKELTEELQLLANAEIAELSDIEALVNKLGILLTTLNEFKQKTK